MSDKKFNKIGEVAGLVLPPVLFFAVCALFIEVVVPGFASLNFAPQHLAAVLALLVGLSLLSDAKTDLRKRFGGRLLAGLAAALAFVACRVALAGSPRLSLIVPICAAVLTLASFGANGETLIKKK